MQFTKMHGIGNDFIMVDVTGPGGKELLTVAKNRSASLCDRKFGVGADGVIAISPSDNADFAMRTFNPDGSEAEMCGNGIRCFAKYVYDNHLSDKEILRVKTGAGILTTEATVKDGYVDLVKVDMGPAILERADTC